MAIYDISLADLRQDIAGVVPTELVCRRGRGPIGSRGWRTTRR
jgi:hypothetical protein